MYRFKRKVILGTVIYQAFQMVVGIHGEDSFPVLELTATICFWSHFWLWSSGWP